MSGLHFSALMYVWYSLAKIRREKALKSLWNVPYFSHAVTEYWQKEKVKIKYPSLSAHWDKQLMTSNMTDKIWLNNILSFLSEGIRHGSILFIPRGNQGGTLHLFFVTIIPLYADDTQISLALDTN